MTDRSARSTLHVRILGSVGGKAARPLVVEGTKARHLLALLTLRVGRIVSVEQLIEGLWGSSAPRTARSALQVYGSQLRKAIVPAGAPWDTLRTAPAGYSITQSQVDLRVFEELATEARSAADRDELPRAATCFNDALALWGTRPLADVRDAPFAPREAARLENLRLAVKVQLFAVEVRPGNADKVVSLLRPLVSEDPAPRHLRSQLRLVLATERAQDVVHELEAGCGVRVRVQATVRRCRGPHRHDACGAHRGPVSTAADPEDRCEAAAATVIGREEELHRAGARLRRPDVWLVTGTGANGIGKTHLALAAAARARSSLTGDLAILSL